MKFILALIFVTSFQTFAADETEGEQESPNPAASQAALALSGCDPSKHAAGADTVVASTAVVPGQAIPNKPAGNNAEDPKGRKSAPGKEGAQLRRTGDVVAVVAVSNDPFGQPCPRY